MTPMGSFLRWFRRPPQPHPGPLGLSEDQCKAILALRELPGWGHYQHALETLAEVQSRPLLDGIRSHDEYLFQAGVLAAFRRLLAVPDALAAYLTSKDTQHDRAKHGDHGPPSHLLNSPWYDLASRFPGSDPLVRSPNGDTPG